MEWLPKSHLVYFILDVVAQLNLRDIDAALQSKDARGERPYAPAMMVSLLLYAYCVGVFSSRKVARATYEDVAFRVLAGGSNPHFTTINQFRLEHRERLASLFVQVLQLCQKAGLVKLGHVAFDGTKVQANASKHKAMSYDRMNEEEKRLQAEVEALLHQAEKTDRQEDEEYGVGCDPEDLPAELSRRETRLERLRAAKAELEREAAQVRAEELRRQAKEQREKAEDAAVDEAERKRARTRANKSEQSAQDLAGDNDDRHDDPPPATSNKALPHHRVQTTTDGKPAPKAQRNFTDADSRIMVRDGAFIQAFNAQVAVDEESQVIVAEAVTNQSPDQEHLIPMVERAVQNCVTTPEKITADTGYFSKENVVHCDGRGIEAFIAVGRERKKDGGIIGGLARSEAAASMQTRLISDRGRATYRRRKAVVEPVFGQIREARGFRRFLTRGLSKVRNEWTLVCLTHNLLKLYRRAPALAPA
jgi:transposase